MLPLLPRAQPGRSWTHGSPLIRARPGAASHSFLSALLLSARGSLRPPLTQLQMERQGEAGSIPACCAIPREVQAQQLWIDALWKQEQSCYQHRTCARQGS